MSFRELIYPCAAGSRALPLHANRFPVSGAYCWPRVGIGLGSVSPLLVPALQWQSHTAENADVEMDLSSPSKAPASILPTDRIAMMNLYMSHFPHPDFKPALCKYFAEPTQQQPPSYLDYLNANCFSHVWNSIPTVI